MLVTGLEVERFRASSGVTVLQAAVHQLDEEASTCPGTQLLVVLLVKHGQLERLGAPLQYHPVLDDQRRVEFERRNLAPRSPTGGNLYCQPAGSLELSLLARPDVLDVGLEQLLFAGLEGGEGHKLPGDVLERHRILQGACE